MVSNAKRNAPYGERGGKDFECGRHDLREETVGRKQRESASLLIGQSKRKSQVHNNLRIPEIQDSSWNRSMPVHPNSKEEKQGTGDEIDAQTSYYIRERDDRFKQKKVTRSHKFLINQGHCSKPVTVTLT